MRRLLTVAVLFAALPVRAGETPQAAAARAALEPYAKSFDIRLIPLTLKSEDDFLSTNIPFVSEKKSLDRVRACFRDGRELSGGCGQGTYLSAARFKTAYEAAASKGGKLDHRDGVRWFCGLVVASRGYFGFYPSTYYGTPVAAVDYAQGVTDAEAALLKETVGVDLVKESRYQLAGCEEDLVEAYKQAGLIAKEPGPDAPTAPPEPAKAPCVVEYKGVDDLRRLQAEGKRFVWFGGTLWGTWTKDLESLGLLLECRGPRWVGSFAGVVDKGSSYTGGALFNGCALRYPGQPQTFAAIDWAKVKEPARRKACKELSKRLKR